MLGLGLRAEGAAHQVDAAHGFGEDPGLWMVRARLASDPKQAVTAPARRRVKELRATIRAPFQTAPAAGSYDGIGIRPQSLSERLDRTSS